MVEAPINYYTIEYIDTKTRNVCSSDTVALNSCNNGYCSRNFQVENSKCPFPTDTIDVLVKATNIFGEGNGTIFNLNSK